MWGISVETRKLIRKYRPWLTHAQLAELLGITVERLFEIYKDNAFSDCSVISPEVSMKVLKGFYKRKTPQGIARDIDYLYQATVKIINTIKRDLTRKPKSGGIIPKSKIVTVLYTHYKLSFSEIATLLEEDEVTIRKQYKSLPIPTEDIEWAKTIIAKYNKEGLSIPIPPEYVEAKKLLKNTQEALAKRTARQKRENRIKRMNFTDTDKGFRVQAVQGVFICTKVGNSKYEVILLPVFGNTTFTKYPIKIGIYSTIRGAKAAISNAHTNTLDYFETN